MSTLFKDIIKLQSKAAFRRETGRFVVEGIRMVREIPKSRISTLIFSEGFRTAHAEEALQLSDGLPASVVKTVPDRDFDKLSDTKTPQGVLAVVSMTEYPAAKVISDPDGFYIFLEDLQDPGNLGTILRSAEAAGASAVIMNETTVDIYNPKVIRATMGAMLRLPFAVVNDLSDFICRFKAGGGRVFAAHLKGASDYACCDYRKKSAFLIGNEGNGLSDAVTALSDERIIIPMAGEVESLNAAMAATILLFEAARQRRER